MRRKAVYKPKSNIYKDIIRLTQSVLYIPAPEKYFAESFPRAGIENVREALSYLCHIGYLCHTDDKCYAVAYDYRTVLRGIYHSDGKNGHLHPDSLRRLYGSVFVPEKWSLGAQHNDRVEVAVEGDLFDFTDSLNGVVHSIIEPFDDLFVGRLQKVDGKYVVFPEDKEYGFFVYVSEFYENADRGTTVLAKLDNAVKTRQTAAENADIRQNKKSIVWSEICGGDEIEHLFKEKIRSCTVIKTLDNRHEKLLRKYDIDVARNLRADSELKAIGKKTGKPEKRDDLTENPAMLLSEQCAVHISKKAELFYVSVHVPDVADLFIPESESEAELLKRCFGDDIFPEDVKKNLKFSDRAVRNAFSVSFTADEKGNISDAVISRSRIYIEKKRHSMYRDLSERLVADGISGCPVICAANDAAAMWFDDKDAPAPFTHICFSDNAEVLMGIACKSGLCESVELTLENVHRILKNAGEKNMLNEAVGLINESICVQTEAIGRDSATVMFCSPLENYLSVLVQYCWVKSRRMRTTEQKRDHLRFLFERIARYNYRVAQIENYRTAYSNLNASRAIERNKKYHGSFVARTSKNEALFFVNGSFGTVNTDIKFKPGQEAELYFDDTSLDCLELKYKLSE